MAYFHIQTSLQEFMRLISIDEYMLRLRFIREKSIKPSLTDKYLMELMAVVDRKFSSNPKSISMYDYLLAPKPPAKVLTVEEQIALNKKLTLAHFETVKYA